MEEWLSEQQALEVQSWDRAVDEHYPEYRDIWADPKAHVEALTQSWNHLEAVRRAPWADVLRGDDLRVLDLGTGTGWLAAELSKRPNIVRIDALDSSRRYLTEMLPGVVELIGGDISRISPVLGLFEPLMVEDDTYDVVVSSSAVHHALNLTSVLRELRRVVRPDGAVVLLNEVPIDPWVHVKTTLRITLETLRAGVRGQLMEIGPSASPAGILYDAHLGDRTYTMQQWAAAFRSAGLDAQVMGSGLPPYQNRDSNEVLTHFILRPKPGP